MKAKDVLVKTLAVLGSVLVWLPVLAPIFFGLASLLAEGVFHFDFLMPAELGLLAIVGTILLVTAASLVRSGRARLIAGSMAVGIVAVVGGQGIAMVTGLASGEIEPTGWQWSLVLTSLGVYVLALVGVGVGGALLVRDLFKK